jgi:hypothetical protein
MPRSVFGVDHPFRLNLPKYVHVVDTEDFSLPISDKAVILSTPCRSHSGQSNLVSSLPQRAPGDERFRIGLIHGQTFDMASFSEFPIERGAAEARSGLSGARYSRLPGRQPDARADGLPWRPRPRHLAKWTQEMWRWCSFLATGSDALWCDRARRFVEVAGHGLPLIAGLRRCEGHWAAANRPQAQGGNDGAARRVRRAGHILHELRGSLADPVGVLVTTCPVYGCA